MNREQMTERVTAILHPLMPVPEVIADRILDVILPQVTTVAELEALPDGAIVSGGKHLLQSKRQIKGKPVVWFEFYDGGWHGSGLMTSTGLSAVLPLTVMWQPEVTA